LTKGLRFYVLADGPEEEAGGAGNGMSGGQEGSCYRAMLPQTAGGIERSKCSTPMSLIKGTDLGDSLFRSPGIVVVHIPRISVWRLK
jgi:hypothetical protein